MVGARVRVLVFIHNLWNVSKSNNWTVNKAKQNRTISKTDFHWLIVVLHLNKHFIVSLCAYCTSFYSVSRFGISVNFSVFAPSFHLDVIYETVAFIQIYLANFFHVFHAWKVINWFATLPILLIYIYLYNTWVIRTRGRRCKKFFFWSNTFIVGSFSKLTIIVIYACKHRCINTVCCCCSCHRREDCS